MSKNLKTFTTELAELAPVINEFSEPVQVRIIDKYLEILELAFMPVKFRAKEDLQQYQIQLDEDGNPRKPMISIISNGRATNRKKPGATKILNQVLQTEFFEDARTIAEIADHCATVYESSFATSELSGILLKLANEERLVRTRDEVNRRFVYSKPAAA